MDYILADNPNAGGVERPLPPLSAPVILPFVKIIKAATLQLAQTFLRVFHSGKASQERPAANRVAMWQPENRD